MYVFLWRIDSYREELALSRTIILLRRLEAGYGEVQSFAIVVSIAICGSN